MNIWHDIDEARIGAEDFVVAVEIPKGTKLKYEIDKDTGMIILDRLLKTSMASIFLLTLREYGANQKSAER